MRPRTDTYAEPERQEMILRLVQMGVNETDAEACYPTAGSQRKEAEAAVVGAERKRKKALSPSTPQDFSSVAAAKWKIGFRALTRRKLQGQTLKGKWTGAFNAGPGSDPSLTKRQVFEWARAWFAEHCK